MTPELLPHGGAVIALREHQHCPIHQSSSGKA
jgi:hypothetical protein